MPCRHDPPERPDHPHRFTVAEDESRQRLDAILGRRLPDHSRTFLQKLVRAGHVTIDGARPSSVRSGRLMAAGEVVLVRVPAPAPSRLLPEPIPLDILHEDRWLLVINKPSGMVVHPGAGRRTGTLVHALMNHCRDLSGIGGVERPGIVHRLDKETSGVIVVAKDDGTHRDLSRQFQGRTVRKSYLALVHGRLGSLSGLIDVPIGRDTRRRVKISPRTSRPREAITKYRVLERFPGHTWLEISPRTGRTHQIRVHLKVIGHPIVGDTLYGGTRGKDADHPTASTRLVLHAFSLGFVHPATHRQVAFEAPLPAELEALLASLRP
ncbi:MAG: RluA family pseudouridine synthase [Acidobacteriota bacterium]